MFQRLEALIALALAAAKNAFAGILALRNQAVAEDALDDQTAPAGVILAAIELTPRASQNGVSRWLMVANWRGTASAADTITLELSELQGPPTAFSGGSVEQIGGGPTNLPTVRYARAGAVTATSANPPLEMGQQSVTTPGAGATGVSCSGLAVFAPAAAANPSLVLVKISAGSTLTLQALTILLFELP